MKMLSRKFHKSSLKEKKYLYISYVINLVIINIFVMISDQSYMINDTLSDNDYAQLIAIFSSIVVVAVIVIVFFQWIISQLFTSLYESRKTANINLRLIGISNNQLARIYFKEYLAMNVITIPIGIVLSVITFYLIAIMLTLRNFVIPVEFLLLGIILHLTVTSFSFMKAIFKNNRRDLVAQMRSKSNLEDNTKFNFSDLLVVLIGILIGVIPAIIPLLTNELIFIQLSRLLYILAIVIVYKVLLKALFKFLFFISKKIKFGVLLISNSICLGELKKTTTSCVMVILTCTIFLGLQSLYTTARINFGYFMDETLHFESRLYIEDGYFTADEINSMGINAETSFSTVYLMSEEHRRIIGIDKNYLNNYETIILEEGKTTSVNLAENLEDPNWNGLLISSTMISEENLGTTISVSDSVQDIELAVAYGHISNFIDVRTSYVGKAYFEDALQTNGKYNMIFLKQPINMDNIPPNAIYETKDEIIATGVSKVIKSTETIELFSLIIVLCAIIAFINLNAINAAPNNSIISKMRGMGVSATGVKKVYLLVATIPLMISFIFIYFFANLFSWVSGYVMSGAHYMQYGITTVPYIFILLFAIIVSVNVFCQFLFVKNSLFSDKYINILRGIN